MKSISLQDIYDSTNISTRSAWKENAGTGAVRGENYYDPVKLALATGIQPPMPISVSRLLNELRKLTKDDPLADTLPTEGFHFTFLPLTLPLYQVNEPLPEKVQQLTDIWSEYHAKRISISHLRLVALPSQLLLAGFPDRTALAMRKSFCDSVLASRWKNELLLRHHNIPLPAPFWHSTILRYNAAFLPPALRQFFLQHQDKDFGEVSGELTLARINYNWTNCYPLAW